MKNKQHTKHFFFSKTSDDLLLNKSFCFVFFFNFCFGFNQTDQTDFIKKIIFKLNIHLCVCKSIIFIFKCKNVVRKLIWSFKS